MIIAAQQNSMKRRTRERDFRATPPKAILPVVDIVVRLLLVVVSKQDEGYEQCQRRSKGL